MLLTWNRFVEMCFRRSASNAVRAGSLCGSQERANIRHCERANRGSSEGRGKLRPLRTLGRPSGQGVVAPQGGCCIYFWSSTCFPCCDLQGVSDRPAVSVWIVLASPTTLLFLLSPGEDTLERRREVAHVLVRGINSASTSPSLRT